MAPLRFAARARSRRTARPARSRPADYAAASVAAPLGGMSARAFLAGHWQKSPVFVRQAVPDFTGLFSFADLIALAARDDVESRLVQRHGARWSLEHGPFAARALRRLPPRNWTLLVQGVNLHDARADALLRRFAFLPFARLDDLMVSYAAPGGGVGPHLDAYDVFLLQGFGRRRWRFGATSDATFRPGLPLRILRRFMPEHDEVLGPGDMLYLPPAYAHDGVAVEACTTYSIGFRAPSATELGTAFLGFLQEELALAGRYTDPDLRPTAEPARVDGAMRRKVERMLRGVRWTRADVARFLGTWLSEPKPSVFFERPQAPLSRRRFEALAGREGVRLDLRTQLLYDDAHLFVNGTALALPARGAAHAKRLADARRLPAEDIGGTPAPLLRMLHDWYRHGFVHIGSA